MLLVIVRVVHDVPLLTLQIRVEMPLELRLAVSENPLMLVVLEQRFCDAVCCNFLDDCLLRLNVVIIVWLSGASGGES